MTKIIFVRHGQSKCNEDGKICGSGTDPNLTEEGIRQIHQLGMQLKTSNIQIDFMVVSNMTRTNHTASILNQYLNIDKIYYDYALQEKNYGIFEGKYSNESQILKTLGHDEVIPGGESNAGFIARIIKALCPYLKAPDPVGIGTVGIVVAHGYVGEMIAENLMNKSIYLKNGEFFVIEPAKIPDFIDKCGVTDGNSFLDQL